MVQVAGRPLRGAAPRNAASCPVLRIRGSGSTHGLWRIRDVRGRVGQPHDGSAVRAARPLRPELLLDRARLHGRTRRLLCSPLRLGEAASEDGDPPRLAHRDRDAGLQRTDRPNLRGPGGHPGIGGGDGPRRGVRLFHPVRFHEPGRLDRGGARLPTSAREGRPGQPDLLPAPREEPPSQGGKHRGFRDPLGRRLRAHARARRRQPHDGRLHRAACGRHGGGPQGRHHPVAADHREPQHALCPPAAICGAARWPGDRHGARRLVGPRRKLLGAQRDHPHAGIRGALRPARPEGQAAVRRPRPEPRLRRSRADAAGRLVRLHASRTRGQLRGEPALSHRSVGSRPALVPRQPAALAHHRRSRAPASDAPAFRDRDHVLSRVAAVAAATGGGYRARPADDLYPP